MTWWLIGDLSSPGLVVGAACLVVLGWLYRTGTLDRGGLINAAIAVGLGFWIGMAARVFTAGGIGANIGSGLVFMATIGGIVSLVAYTRSKGAPST